MIPSKRSSISSNKHHSSIVQIDLQPILDTQKVQKSIEYIKQLLKNHLKDKKYEFQKTELKELYKLINIIQQHYIQTHKDNDSIIVALRQQLQKIKDGQQQQLIKMKQKYMQQFKELQRNHNQKILALNNDYGRKYQNYKEIIEKLTKNLHSSQKIHQNNHAKMLQLTKFLTIIKENNKNQQNISKGIKDIVQQINLRQQNSFISSKSDQISIDQIDISHKKLENNLIEDDSMSQVDQNRFTPIEKKLEIWLCRLICYGLFQKKNEEMIKRLITFTSKYQQAGQMIKENSVFNLILQYFINNMKNNHEQAKKYLQGSLSYYETQEQYSQVQLRNINNLSDLSINQGHHDDLNFKKK